MIVTVTMNPAIDKTVEIDRFIYQGLNRLKNVIQDVGGKGINVSKTIKALGGNTVATGFLAGNAGAIVNKVLKEKGIKADFIGVDGETRTNMKVVEPGGILTELNEPGPQVSDENVKKLMTKLEEYADENTLFILAGSIPQGVPSNIYGTIIKKIKEKNAKVFLDADGELFVKAIEAGPSIIKPNKFELEQYFGMENANEEKLIWMCKELQKKGVNKVAVSMGKEGALFIWNDKVLKAQGLKVEAYSAVGAGDAMVAAISFGIDQGYDEEVCIRLGVAASAGAVMTKGTKPQEREIIDKLMKEVQLETIG